MNRVCSAHTCKSKTFLASVTSSSTLLAKLRVRFGKSQPQSEHVKPSKDFSRDHRISRMNASLTHTLSQLRKDPAFPSAHFASNHIHPGISAGRFPFASWPFFLCFLQENKSVLSRHLCGGCPCNNQLNGKRSFQGPCLRELGRHRRTSFANRNKVFDTASTIMVRIPRVRPKTYTTAEAAVRVGITRQTLYAWIEAKKVKAPRLLVIGRRSMRLWTEANLARLHASKEKHYGKGRSGRPKKKK